MLCFGSRSSDSLALLCYDAAVSGTLRTVHHGRVDTTMSSTMGDCRHEGRQRPITLYLLVILLGLLPSTVGCQRAKPPVRSCPLAVNPRIETPVIARVAAADAGYPAPTAPATVVSQAAYPSPEAAETSAPTPRGDARAHGATHGATHGDPRACQRSLLRPHQRLKRPHRA